MSTELPLLRRVSEEEGDPDLFPPHVHQLHESGKAQAARKALQKHVTTERDTARRDKQMELAEDPYLWLEPMKGTPPLGTVNGIGFRLYGTHKPDGHGHYISTLYFTFVFIPLLPITSYVVQDAEGGGWYFLAKAPLPLFGRVWQLAAAALALLGVAGGVYGIYQDRTHVDLLAHNGSDVLMRVTVGDQTEQVPPHRFVEFDGLPTEALRATAVVPSGVEGGVVVQEVELDLTPHGGGDVVYNVGQFDIFEEAWVRYGPGDPPAGRFVGAGPLVVAEQDYVLRPAPKSLQVSDSKSHVDKSVLQPLDDTWSTSERVETMVSQMGIGPAADWAVAHVLLDPDDPAPQGLAMVALLQDPARGAALVEQLGALHPKSVPAHRFAQDVRIALGESPHALVVDYRDRAGAAPDDADLAYLHARMVARVDPERGRAAFEVVLAREPSHAWAQRAAAWEALRVEDMPLASRYFTSFAGDTPERVVEMLPLRLMVARVGAGSAWSDEVDALLDEAKAGGDSAFDIARRRLVHRAVGTDVSTAGLLDAYVKEWVAAGGEPATPKDEAWVSLLIARCRGDAGGIDAVSAKLGGEPGMDVALAEARLYAALSDGGDRAALGPVLATLDAGEPTGDTELLMTAAMLHTDRGEAESRVRALMEAHSPEGAVRILDPALDRTDAEAVRARMAEIDPPQRGIAWAILAVALEADGRGDVPLAAEARTLAQTWTYPGNAPRWAPAG